MSAALLEMPVAEAEDLFALVPEDMDWVSCEQQTTPVHTAQRLKRNDARKYAILKEALAAGSAKTTLARTHKVGINTLYAIIDAELGGMEKYNQQMALKFKNLASLAIDRAMELVPDEKSLVPLMMTAGISVDKALSLSGMAGSVIEHRHVVDTSAMEAFNEKLRAIREAKGRVVETPIPALETTDV